jgi:stress-induced morphogen
MAKRADRAERVSRPAKKDAHVDQLERLLERSYKAEHPKARITVYRYNSGSIRVRIIDPDFRGHSLAERDHEIYELLKAKAPEDLLEQISVRLLITPEERKTSLMSLEFDDPTPSSL